MKKILGTKVALNLTLIIMLIGGITMTLGFGTCLYLARQEVARETRYKVNQDLSYIRTYVDGELKRVEDVAYTLVSTKFGRTTRNDVGEGFVVIDPSTYKIPSEEECFMLLNQFLDANPSICGVAIGFEKFLYQDTADKYGFAAYVTNVTGKKESLNLGNIHDFHEKEWYKQAAALNKPYWSKPFRETLAGKAVVCFSLPLHGLDNRLIGVIALDIDTEMFRKKCAEISPFPGAQVSMVDRDFCFVAHPDSTFLLRSVTEVGIYDDYLNDDSMKEKMQQHLGGSGLVNKGTQHEAMFYYAPIKRTGWTIAIECPKDEVFRGVERMKRDTTLIAIGCILFMIVCFIHLFRKFKDVTASKAGMESELKIASGIQMGMIPKLYPAFPDRDEIDVYGFLKPAKDVGGDLYDYFIRDNKLFFCIGDVSGKGVPASLFMTVIRSLFRNVSLHTEDPAEIVSSLNKALSEGNVNSMFCTLFLGVLNLENGHLDYCNAGHNAPIVRRFIDGKMVVDYVQLKTNLAVGVFDTFNYVKEEVDMKPGEALFMYTDGVTEAENAQKELFGEDAVLAVLGEARAQHMRTAKEFIDYVYKVLKVWAVGAEQSDDITMVVMEYRGKKA